MGDIEAPVPEEDHNASTTPPVRSIRLIDPRLTVHFSQPAQRASDGPLIPLAEKFTRGTCHVAMFPTPAPEPAA